MKFKRVKLVTSLLSVGALSAILIPTITLTSCSATANPYVPEFTCRDNSSNYTFSAKFSNGNKLSSVELKDSSGTIFDASSFSKEWKKIKESEAGKDLPETIWNVDKQITNADVVNIVRKQNYLTLFSSVMNNLKNIYENYNSAFISKNPNPIQLIKDELTKSNKFVYFMTQGLNESKTYARLWLSDIQFNMSVALPGIGFEVSEENFKNEKDLEVSITGIKLKYQWYELGNDGSTLISNWDELKKYKETFDSTVSIFNPKESDKKIVLEEKDLSFTFNVSHAMKLYFSRQYNNKTVTNGDKKEDKHYLVGLISPAINKPLSFPFGGNEEQQRRKTDFFNREVLNYIKSKNPTQWSLDELFAKTGFLVSNNELNEKEDNINLGDESSRNAYIQSGKTFINGLFGGK